MKNKLLELGLSETITDEILDVWEIHLKTVERYSKPGGVIALTENLSEIERLSKKLAKRLQSLTSFENQLLTQASGLKIKINDLTMQAGLLSVSCSNAKKIKSRFSRREPFCAS